MTDSSGPSIKFSVCAFVDLLGFSSHLEVSGSDLRTDIGEQAIGRLSNLEEGLALLRIEGHSAPDSIPAGFCLQRINDAVICTLDLDDVLLPRVGQTNFVSLSWDALEKYFDLDSPEVEHTIEEEVERLLHMATDPIRNFIGMVARLHLFIEERERQGFFPGARTVVSTGFRRPFDSDNVEADALSANFAFANATLADKQLHGPHFFVDNNIIELCSRDRLARNLLQFACFEWGDQPYDVLLHESPSLRRNWGAPVNISAVHPLTLLRRDYQFRRLNPAPLSFLQHLAFFRPCLDDGALWHQGNPYFQHVLDAMDHGIDVKRSGEANPPRTFLFSRQNHLTSRLNEFREMFLHGSSASRVTRERMEYVARMGHPELMENPAYLKEIEELESRTVDVDVEPISAHDLGDALWQMSASQFTALLPFMDDLDAVRFRTGAD